MGIFRRALWVNTREENEIIDLTDELRGAIADSKLSAGLACVFIAHSTAALLTIENEGGLQKDMRDALQRLFPKELAYEHHRKWGDGNGHSHIRSSFLGTSMTVPFTNGVPDLGTWQQVVLMELDAKARERKVIIQIIGEN
jgi:secondary thiamine-phosphate synthase enzyme